METSGAVTLTQAQGQGDRLGNPPLPTDKMVK